MAADEIEGRDIEALLETRRELGPTYERELLDSFADKIEGVIESRVDAVVATRRTSGRDAAEAGKRQLVLGIVSLGTGIPITAIAGAITDLPGVVVAWVGIVGVNAAHALTSRRDR